MIGLIIIGLIEIHGSLIIVGVDGGTNEIIARRSFVDIFCGRIGVFAGGGITVDCSKYKCIEPELRHMMHVFI